MNRHRHLPGGIAAKQGVTAQRDACRGHQQEQQHDARPPRGRGAGGSVVTLATPSSLETGRRRGIP